MDGNLMIIKVLINGVLFKPVLVDISCKYYSIIDKDFISKLWFSRVNIPP